MRLLLNALSARQGGGQTYVYNFLRHVPMPDVGQVFVIGPPNLQLPSPLPAKIERVQVPVWCVDRPLLRPLWERFYLARLLRRLNIDVVFCTGGMLVVKPPKSCLSVVRFQNMAPFDKALRTRYPLGYMRLRLWLLERLFLKSMSRADLVIFISAFARKVVTDRIPGKIAQDVILPAGLNDDFRTDGKGNLPRPGWLPTGDYFLYVSTLDFYKAQVEVIEAYAHLRRLRPETREKLVLVGPENELYGKSVRAAISRLDLADAVILSGRVPYKELPAAYKYATLNIFASECENCPNILLEALAGGRPTLVSDRPPMPEFAGEAGIYFNPASPEDLAQKMSNVLASPENMLLLGKKALAKSTEYDWASVATKTWEAIKAARSTS